MHYQTIQRMLCVLTLAWAMSLVSTSQAQSQRRGVYGDWQLSTQFGDRSMESILTLMPQREGAMTGSWVSFFGVTELTDVSLEGDQLRFTYTRRGRNGENSSQFMGTLADGKLSGTLTGNQGESKVTGKRAPRVSRAVGDWAMTIKTAERAYKGTLSIRPDADGTLSGEWSSERGTSKLTDLEYSRGELSFQRSIETQDNTWNIQFQGNLRGNNITGTFKSERGEAEGTGERIGGHAIGTWNLAMNFGERSRTQRLRIHGDLSGFYGSTPIEKITLDGDRIQFEATSQFGDRSFTMRFEGEIEGESMKGELSTSQGSREVTGTKRVRPAGRGR